MSEIEAITPDDSNKLQELLNALNETTGLKSLAQKKREIIEQLNAIEVQIDDKSLDFLYKDINTEDTKPKNAAEIANEVYGWEDVLSDRLEIEAALKKLSTD